MLVSRDLKRNPQVVLGACFGMFSTGICDLAVQNTTVAGLEIRPNLSDFCLFFTPPLAGWAWDFGQSTNYGGAWAAFIVIALCNVFLWVSVALMPIPKSVSVPTSFPLLQSLSPSLIDYKQAFHLFLTPTVAFVVVASFLINGLIQVRMNFMSLYMESVGYEGRIIGLMILHNLN